MEKQPSTGPYNLLSYNIQKNCVIKKCNFYQKQGNTSFFYIKTGLNTVFFHGLVV